MDPSDISVAPVLAPEEAQIARATPIVQKARIEAMDVIRGLALFGVLMINLAYWFRVPGLGIRPRDAHGLDRVVMRLEVLLLSGKAMTLFSMLFGVGLAIFLERAEARGPGAMALLARRLWVLMAFGFVHFFLIWNGDVLLSYAVAGLGAMAFLRARTAVLWTAVVLSFVLPAVSAWSPALMELTNTQIPGHYERALHVYGTRSYLDVVSFRFHEFVAIGYRSHIFFWFREIGNMLVGILVWRSGVLRAPEPHRRALRWIAIGGISAGLAWGIYKAILSEFYHVRGPDRGWPHLLGNASTLLFGLGYGAAVLLLLSQGRRQPWLDALAPLGRMAFTNYLMQSLVFTTIFYGYGLGLTGKLGFAVTALIGIVFYVVQVLASTVWLRHFQFGPFEWVWRCLTYGRWQPFRRIGRV